MSQLLKPLQVSNQLASLPSVAKFSSITVMLMLVVVNVQAATTVTNSDTVSTTTPTVTAQSSSGTLPPAASSTTVKTINNTLAEQLKPSNSALSAANQQLLSRNALLQRQVNDLQTQVNVLVYESKGQLFLYGAFTVLISLLVGVFISWLVFVRRERW